MKNRNDAAVIEINLGEPICRKLSEIYFPGEAWVDCHQAIAKKFTELKIIARKFYADKNKIEVLQELNKYTNEDLVDLFMQV